MAKYELIRASKPLTEGEVPPIVKEAKDYAISINGKIASITLTHAMIVSEE